MDLLSSILPEIGSILNPGGQSSAAQTTPAPTTPPPTSAPAPTTAAPPPTSDPAPTTAPPPVSSSAPPVPSSDVPPSSDVSVPPSSAPSVSPTAGPPSSDVPAPSSLTDGAPSPSVSNISSLPSSSAPLPSTDGGGGGGGLVTVTRTTTMGDGTEVTETSIEQRPSGGGTNVGAIVGGVVGGVVGLALIVGLILFLMRRRRKARRDQFDDMMFDPARPQNQGNIDLADGSDRPTVEPYGYTPVTGVAATGARQHQPEMSQIGSHHGHGGYGEDYSEGYSDHGYGGSSSGGAAGVSRQPSSAASNNFAGLGSGYAAAAERYSAQQGYPHPVAEGSSSGGGAPVLPPIDTATAGMSQKQREAYNESQRFHVQNPSNPYGGGPTSPAQVTVHTDGGAYNEPEAPVSGQEIPPTYDSIRQ